MQKLKIAVLVSGGGTNLQAVIDAISRGEINAEIVKVISSKAGAYALERAKGAGIPCEVISPKGSKTLLQSVRQSGAELIVLAGFMRILEPEFVEAYRNRIINVHPSLIPAFCGKGFYGLRVHEAVIESGVRLSGATVHFVDEGCDSGPIIAQKAVEVAQDDTPERLQKRVMEEAEWVLLPQVIGLIADGLVRVENGRVIIESHNIGDRQT